MLWRYQDHERSQYRQKRRRRSPRNSRAACKEVEGDGRIASRENVIDRTATTNTITGAGIAVETGAEIAIAVAVETDGETGPHAGSLRIQNLDLPAKTEDEEVVVGTTSIGRENTAVIGAEAGRGAVTESMGRAEIDIGADLPREGGAQVQDRLGGDLMIQKDHEDDRRGIQETIA